MAEQIEDAASLSKRADALAGAGQLQEALVLYDSALALDAENATAWLNKGNALSNPGRRVGASAKQWGDSGSSLRVA